MAFKTVWTRQHKNVLDILERDGRFTAKKEFVLKSEEVILMLDGYMWLMKNHPDLKRKPADADFPIWLSYSEEASMMPSPDSAVLKLKVDESLITNLNIMKWTAVNNCTYIPKDKEDMLRHKELLKAFGVSDVKAYTTNFYPEIKREIEESRKRVFDDSIDLGNPASYGLIWEIKKEWVQEVKVY